MPGSGGLVAGGLDGVGGLVVLAGQPHDRVGVVLAAGSDGDPGAKRERRFPVAYGLPAVGVVGVGGDAELGVDPVEGLLGVAEGAAPMIGVGVGEHMGQAGVVVAMAGVQVAGEAVGDLVEGPVAELVAAEGGRGLQVRQQLGAALEGVA